MLSMSKSGYGRGLYDFDNNGWKDLIVNRGDVLSRPMPGTVVDQHQRRFFRIWAPAGQARNSYHLKPVDHFPVFLHIHRQPAHSHDSETGGQAG